MSPCHCANCITPPHLLNRLLKSKRPEIREAALSTLLVTSQLRGQRLFKLELGGAVMQGNGRRTIYDMKSRPNFEEAVVARTEDGEDSADDSVNRAFDGLGATRDFYSRIFDRNSIDGRGMRLDAYVHYAEDAIGFNNAYWDGQKMVFGDGDGILFADFTNSLDVIAHELTHGVTQTSSGLVYHKQPGALNESISDVFGSLVKQWDRGQTAEDADWLIGTDIFTPEFDADALRSLKAPGTAYDNVDLGKDPQPAHMRDYKDQPDTYLGDWGGVHINSGIPNKAFYLVATALGGYAWEAPGQIWYASLLASNSLTSFQQFADTTANKAEILFGGQSTELDAVQDAWREVGITVKGSPSSRGRRARPKHSKKKSSSQREEQLIDDLVNQLSQLTAQIKTLAQDITRLKGKK